MAPSFSRPVSPFSDPARCDRRSTDSAASTSPGSASARWTPSDDVYLLQQRRSPNQMSYGELGRRLGRSGLACRLHIHHLRKKLRDDTISRAHRDAMERILPISHLLEDEPGSESRATNGNGPARLLPRLPSSGAPGGFSSQPPMPVSHSISQLPLYQPPTQPPTRTTSFPQGSSVSSMRDYHGITCHNTTVGRLPSQNYFTTPSYPQASLWAGEAQREGERARYEADRMRRQIAELELQAAEMDARQRCAGFRALSSRASFPDRERTPANIPPPAYAPAVADAQNDAPRYDLAYGGTAAPDAPLYQYQKQWPLQQQQQQQYQELAGTRKRRNTDEGEQGRGSRSNIHDLLD